MHPVPSASSTGPRISVSGVRSSWLTFEKNVGLRAIDLRQRFRAKALVDVGLRIRQAGRELTDEQRDEALELGVDRPVRIQPGDEHARRPRLSRLRHRQRRWRGSAASATGRAARQSRPAGRPRDGAMRLVTERAEAATAHRRSADRRSRDRIARVHVAAGDQRRGLVVSVEQIGQRERQVPRVRWRATRSQRAPHLFGRLARGERARRAAQQRRAAVRRSPGRSPR